MRYSIPPALCPPATCAQPFPVHAGRPHLQRQQARQHPGGLLGRAGLLGVWLPAQRGEKLLPPALTPH